MRVGQEIGNRKVAIVGAGYVGSSIAYALALRDIAREIVLIDTNSEKTKGEAFDIRHGIASMGTVDLFVGGYEDCADCDLIILTAGRNRRAKETRLDLIQDNVEIMRDVVRSIQKYYTRGVLLVISNPVDVLTYQVSEWMQLPSGMVFGSGCILDTSRFIRSIADYVGLSTGVIHGYLVGEHGEGQVPIWSRVSVGGIPVEEYCREVGLCWDETVQEKLALQTKQMGSEIIQAKGRTHFGIATCVCHLADAILNMRPTIVSVTSTLEGEHGVIGVALSVPSVVGPGGVQQRIRERWEPEEYRGFFDAVERMRKYIR